MRTLIEAMRILCGRDFWRSFADYWGPAAVAKRMGDWAERMESYRRR